MSHDGHVFFYAFRASGTSCRNHAGLGGLFESLRNAGDVRQRKNEKGTIVGMRAFEVSAQKNDCIDAKRRHEMIRAVF